MKSKLITFFLVLSIILIVEDVYAGFEAPDWAVFPQIKYIVRDDNNIWFVARQYDKDSWELFRYDKKSDKWETVVLPSIRPEPIFAISRSKKYITFLMGRRILEKVITQQHIKVFLRKIQEIKYDKKKKQWQIDERDEVFLDRNITTGEQTEFEKILQEEGYTHWYDLIGKITVGNTVYLIERRQIRKIKDSKITNFKYPLTNIAEVKKRRRLKDIEGVEDVIGNFYYTDKKIWFGIKFYEGEGCYGIGGFGYFDLETEKWKISRPEVLLDSSISAIFVDGDSIWMGTIHYGEGYIAKRKGLLKYEIDTKKWNKFTPENSDILGDFIFSINKDKDTLWLGTEYGISSLNVQNKEWHSYYFRGIYPFVITSLCDENLINDLLNENIQVRINITKWIGKRKLKEAVPNLIQNLNYQDYRGAELQIATADALGEIQSLDAVPHLIKLLDSENDKVRERALVNLGRIGDKRAVEKIFYIFIKSENRDQRRIASKALSQIGEASMPVLLKAINSDDPEIRMFSVAALGDIGNNKVIFDLRKCLRDPDRRVRQVTIRALGKLDGTVIEKDIIKCLRDEDEWVKSAAIDTLVKIKGKFAIPYIIYFLDDENEMLRGNVIYALEKLTGESFGRWRYSTKRYSFGMSENEQRKIEKRWKEWWKENKDNFKQKK